MLIFHEIIQVYDLAYLSAVFLGDPKYGSDCLLLGVVIFKLNCITLE